MHIHFFHLPFVARLLLFIVQHHDRLQKLLFLDTAEGVAGTIRPYWAKATGDRASVVQAQPDMLEIVPIGTSKGSGVKILLDHLGASPDEVYRSSSYLEISSQHDSDRGFQFKMLISYVCNFRQSLAFIGLSW